MEDHKTIVKKLKVLHLITGIDVGGAESYLLSTLRLLDGQRFEVVVCYLRGKGALRIEFESSGIAVRDFSGRWWSVILRSVRLLRFIQSEQFDIVHTHLIRATLVGRVFARLASIRVVFTTEHNVSNWQRRYFVVTLLYRWTARSVGRIFAISSAVKDGLVKVGKIDPAKVEVLHPGVDLSEFKKKVRSSSGRTLGRLTNGYPIIGCVARFDIRKGQRILLDAAVQLRNDYPDLRLVLVGDGETRPALESQAARLGLHSQVVLTGIRRDVKELFSTFDLVVFPSLTEGLPIALLEAMASGSLIVASRVGGIPEAIAEGEEGRLVEPGEPRLLANAIRDALRDKKAATRMKAAARTRCQKEFDVRVSVRRLEKAYEDALKAHH